MAIFIAKAIRPDLMGLFQSGSLEVCRYAPASVFPLGPRPFVSSLLPAALHWMSFPPGLGIIFWYTLNKYFSNSLCD